MVRKNDIKKVDFTIEKVEKGPSYHIIHHIFLPQLPHSLQLKFEAVKNSEKNYVQIYNLKYFMAYVTLKMIINGKHLECGEKESF